MAAPFFIDIFIEGKELFKRVDFLIKLIFIRIGLIVVLLFGVDAGIDFGFFPFADGDLFLFEWWLRELSG